MTPSSSRTVLLPVLLGVAAPLLSYEGGPVLSGGSIAGQVIVRGPAPAKARPIPVTADRKACGAAVPDQRLLVHAGGALENAVVSLADIDAGKPIDPGVRARLDHHGCILAPHVLALAVGQILEVHNSDPVPHTARALLNGDETVFSIALPIQNQAVLQRVKRTGVLHVQSEGRDWMTAYVAVLPHPYVAVTGEDGRFTLDQVPPGKYAIAAWHETLGTARASVTVVAGGEASVSLAFDGR